MLALFAGQGRLPVILAEHLEKSKEPHICYSIGAGENPVTLGTLGSVLETLRDRGCDRICLAGSVDRRTLTIDDPDDKTRPLITQLMEALGAPDGSALSKLHGLLEAQGFAVVGAHEVLPALLPEAGVATEAQPTEQDKADVARALDILAITGSADIGQGCVVENGQALAIEALPGTDFMLAETKRFRAGAPKGGVFAKAAKPGQDLRSDMPTIGPETVLRVIEAGLAGMVIKAGEVLLLDSDIVLDRLNTAGRFLWVQA